MAYSYHHATLISKIPLLVLQTLRSGEQPKHEYDHVFVDEFQDLSPSEHELFVRLRGTSGSLLVLGDPRPSIYAFRGNDRDGLNKLPALIRGSGNAITDVPMSECRRCPEVIVRAANELTNLYPSGPMISTNPTRGNVHVITWRSPNQEAAGMARAVVENFTRFPTQSHLVMVTRRHFGYQLREQIYALNPELRVDLSFSESLLEEWIPREAFLFFCLLADPDAPTWRSWLGYRDAPPAESPTAPARNAPAYLHFLGACDDEVTEGKVMLLSQEDRDKRRGGGGLNLWDRAHRFRTLLESVDWRSLSPEQLADSAFEAPRWAPRPSVDQQTALLDLQAIRDRCQSLLREYRILRPHLDEHELVAGVARQIRYQIATREPFVLGDDVDISVSTMWGAKGVTADNVYIVGLVDEAIPGARRDEYPGTDLDFVEEQRRLFYVSLTRSRRTLVLSRFQNSIRRTTALKLGLRVPPGSSEWVRVTPCRFLVDAMSILPNGVPGASWHGCGD